MLDDRPGLRSPSCSGSCGEVVERDCCNWRPEVGKSGVRCCNPGPPTADLLAFIAKASEAVAGLVLFLAVAESWENSDYYNEDLLLIGVG